MPSISTSNIPTPKSWSEFEDITLAAVKLRFGSSNFYHNGRQGQQQDGVDIWGHDDKCHVGIQCKNTFGGIKIGTIKAEISNAENFTPCLDHLYIATTAKRDATLQENVREISEGRQNENKFIVDVLFWDDICLDLAKDEDVFLQHYPWYRSKPDSSSDHDKALYKEMTTLLTSDGVIGFLDRTNMAGWAFRTSELDPLYNFQLNWDKPEREFISGELETLRKELWTKVNAYCRLISFETFPTENQGFNIVPPEWEYKQSDRFYKVVKELHSLAGEIVALHANFVRKGRALITGSAQSAD